MKKNTKVLLGLGIGAAAFWALSKQAEADESGVKLALINTRTGERVSLDEPGIFGTITNPVENENYSLVATVTNLSTRGGVPIGVYFFITMWGNYSDGNGAMDIWESENVLIPGGGNARFTAPSFGVLSSKVGQTMSFYARLAGAESPAAGFRVITSVGPRTTAAITGAPVIYEATVTLSV